MGSMSLVQLLAWLGMGLAVVVCARVVWRAVTRPRGLVREACCARCRYPVEGLEGWECPECGADLRVVGVITPELELRRRGSAAMACAAWTVLAIAFGILAWTGVSHWARHEAARAVAAAPLVTRSQEVRVFVPRGGSAGRRGITVKVSRTEGVGEKGDAGVSAFEATIETQAGPGEKPQRITVEGDGSYRWTDGEGKEVAAGEGLTRDALADFLMATGSPIDTADEEAGELLTALQSGASTGRGGVVVLGGRRGGALVQVQSAVNRSTTQLPVDTSFYEALPRWVAWGMMGLWGLGLVAIPARRRRLVTRAGRPHRSAPHGTTAPAVVENEAEEEESTEAAEKAEKRGDDDGNGRRRNDG